jgi:hypothetical protein
MGNEFIEALRLRSVDVEVPSDVGMIGRSDLDRLLWSTAPGRIMYTFNAGDF